MLGNLSLRWVRSLGASSRTHGRISLSLGSGGGGTSLSLSLSIPVSFALSLTLQCLGLAATDAGLTAVTGVGPGERFGGMGLVH